jgi:hypothetical protein
MKDGEPCSHPGCQYHITHPCESCGRIGANKNSIRQKYFDLKMLIKQLRLHEESGPEENETFSSWAIKKKELQILVDNVVFKEAQMKITIIAVNFKDAIDLCNAAGWPIGGSYAPRVLNVHDGNSLEKMRGTRGGLCIITDAARVAVGVGEFISQAVIQGMTVSCVVKPQVSAGDELVMPSLKIKI